MWLFLSLCCFADRNASDTVFPKLNSRDPQDSGSANLSRRQCFQNFTYILGAPVHPSVFGVKRRLGFRIFFGWVTRFLAKSFWALAVLSLAYSQAGLVLAPEGGQNITAKTELCMHKEFMLKVERGNGRVLSDCWPDESRPSGGEHVAASIIIHFCLELFWMKRLMLCSVRSSRKLSFDSDRGRKSDPAAKNRDTLSARSLA